MGDIDVNKIEEDVIEEYIAPENEETAEMLDRLSKDMFGISIKELYLKNILSEIHDLMAMEKKTPQDREKLLNYLKTVDQVMGFSKDKRGVKIVTQMGSMTDIMGKIKD